MNSEGEEEEEKSYYGYGEQEIDENGMTSSGVYSDTDSTNPPQDNPAKSTFRKRSATPMKVHIFFSSFSKFLCLENRFILSLTKLSIYNSIVAREESSIKLCTIKTY